MPFVPKEAELVGRGVNWNIYETKKNSLRGWGELETSWEKKILTLKALIDLFYRLSFCGIKPQIAESVANALDNYGKERKYVELY